MYKFRLFAEHNEPRRHQSDTSSIRVGAAGGQGSISGGSVSKHKESEHSTGVWGSTDSSSRGISGGHVSASGGGFVLGREKGS